LRLSKRTLETLAENAGVDTVFSMGSIIEKLSEIIRCVILEKEVVQKISRKYRLNPKPEIQMDNLMRRMTI
jgi:hypothetical protein